MSKNKLLKYNPVILNQLKNAIRDLATINKVSKYKLSDSQIFEFMLDNRRGVRWITVERVRRMRLVLPKSYQKKTKD